MLFLLWSLKLIIKQNMYLSISLPDSKFERVSESLYLIIYYYHLTVLTYLSLLGVGTNMKMIITYIFIVFKNC